jgi:hypothetical protein
MYYVYARRFLRCYTAHCVITGATDVYKYRDADKPLARNKLQRQNVLSFIYAIYNNNSRNISTIYTVHITRLASNEIFSLSNKIHREEGRAKDLSAPIYRSVDKYTVWAEREICEC